MDRLPPTCPRQPTPLVGRHQELEELEARLAAPDCRLLTLVGPGGIGKTRLALETARRVAPRFAQGLAFVAGQSIQTPQALGHALVDALGLPPASHHDTPWQQLQEYLQHRQMLLVLDGLEHLAESGLTLLDLLRHAPCLRLLVTAREPLQVEAEWRFPVHGLDYPPHDHVLRPETFSAVQLFVERARRMRWDFSLAREGADVVRICRLLEGNPLALELAAGWTHMLPCGAILAETQRSIHFLSTTRQDLPPRHRSMQALFDQSWRHLSPHLQAVLARLSVFPASFDFQAAQQVANASPQQLAALVDKSLLAADGNGRCQLHLLIQQYAAEKLAAQPRAVQEARTAHARFYCQLLANHTPAMRGGDQPGATRAIAAERENVGHAWQWAAAQGDVDCLDLAAVALSLFCQFQGRYREGVEAFGQAIRALDNGPPSPQATRLLAELLTHQGWLLIRLGRLADAQAALTRSRALLEDLDADLIRNRQADPLPALGVLALVQGQYGEARLLGLQARADSAARQDTGNLMFAWYVLCNAALGQGDLATARSCAQEAFAIASRAGNLWFLAYCHNGLGQIAQATGDVTGARQHFQAGYTLRQQFNDPEGMAVALTHLGQLALQSGDVAEARRCYRQSLELYQGLGDRGGLATALAGLGQVSVVAGDHLAAARLLHQALQEATALASTPLMLTVLLVVGQFQVHTGQPHRGRRLMAWAAHHPQSPLPTRAAAAALVDKDPPPAEAVAGKPPPSLVHTALADLATATHPPAPTAPVSLEALTPRELEVLRLMAGGCTNAEIAARLGISLGTVKAHTHHIYGKLDVRSRTEAVMQASRRHLI